MAETFFHATPTNIKPFATIQIPNLYGLENGVKCRKTSWKEIVQIYEICILF